MEETFIKRLMTSIKCADCGQRYDIDSISVLGHHEDLWFLRTLCSACHAQCLVAVVVKEDKRPEVITDLTEAESNRFRGAGALTADEVLDMHRFLNDFDGDFSHLFSQQEA
jgi:hypothetical protein